MGYGIAIQDIEEVDLYRYGRSQQVFRGPKPDLGGPYISFIGGSETFGKFVRNPFPKAIEDKVSKTCVNFGTPGAGPGYFLKDPVILEACSNSDICVVQVMDATALSNRMYSVFPRRNTRLRSVSEILRFLYPNQDFSKFRHVSGMLRKLRTVDEEAYEIVVNEQRSAWVARMLELLGDIETPKILLWLTPDLEQADSGVITSDMIEQLAKQVDRVVTIPIEHREISGPVSLLQKESGWMNQAVHTKVAQVVTEALDHLQAQKKPA